MKVSKVKRLSKGEDNSSAAEAWGADAARFMASRAEDAALSAGLADEPPEENFELPAWTTKETCVTSAFSSRQSVKIWSAYLSSAQPFKNPVGRVNTSSPFLRPPKVMGWSQLLNAASPTASFSRVLILSHWISNTVRPHYPVNRPQAVTVPKSGQPLLNAVPTETLRAPN